MPADNTHLLAAAAQRRHDDAYQRTRDALRAAEADGRTVTISALAIAAGVSRAFLYANPDLLDAARQLRRDTTPTTVVPVPQRASEASLLRRIEALTERNKILRVENQDLRRRLEVAHGQLRHQSARPSQ